MNGKRLACYVASGGMAAMLSLGSGGMAAWAQGGSGGSNGGQGNAPGGNPSAQHQGGQSGSTPAATAPPNTAPANTGPPPNSQAYSHPDPDPNGGAGGRAAAPGQTGAAPSSSAADHGAGQPSSRGNSSPAAGAPATATHGSPPAAAGGSSDMPPGNNGYVKIDDYSMDGGAPGPDNDPHVSCDGFSVLFYGFDGGNQTASVIVTPQAPTGGSGTYTASTTLSNGTRTAGDQLDGSIQVSQAQLSSFLAGLTPTRQGYHLRLETETPYSQGSDDKSKVFWLQPCGMAAPATAAGGSATDTGTGFGSALPGGATSSESGTLSAFSSLIATKLASQEANFAIPWTEAATASRVVPTRSGGSQVAAAAGRGSSARGVAGAPNLAASASPAAAARPAGNSGGGFLAFTGAEIAGLVVAGLGMIGTGFLLRSRRHHRALA